jgi:hypothetical protein
MNPIKNDPVQLMTKVPYGNRVPMRSLIYPPNQNRAIAPMKPPMPTIKYLSISPSSALPCERDAQFREQYPAVRFAEPVWSSPRPNHWPEAPARFSSSLL